MNSAKLPVLFDASWLGAGHRVASNRTGIYRYADNLIRQIATRGEIELELCAPYRLSEALAYFEAHALLSERPLAHSPSQMRAVPLANRALNFIDDTLPNRRLPFKAARRTAAIFLQAVRRFQRRIDANALSRAKIYHSPWHAVPAEIARHKAHPFLTVYDMTPILFPQHFEAGLCQEFQSILKSIDARTSVLAISQATKDDLCRLQDIHPERVFVTHLAADKNFARCHDLERLQNVKKRYSLPNEPYFLCLGTLHPRKNNVFVIRSFIELIRQNPELDLHLVIAGEKGWKYDAIFSEAESDSQISKHIHFTGFVDDEDLPALYTSALAFLYMSIYEGFGLPPLEAMQCGVPVVTSNTSSLPEVIGDAGIMLNPQDRDGLCQALWNLYCDGSLRRRLTDAGQERAKLFSWERCADETIAAYRVATEKLNRTQ